MKWAQGGLTPNLRKAAVNAKLEESKYDGDPQHPQTITKHVLQCNEVHPVCQNCTRREIECDFSRNSTDNRSSTPRGSDSRQSSESQGQAHDQSQSNHDKVPTPPPVPAVPVDPFLLPNLESTRRTTDLAIGDLELLHHFSTVTCGTIADACASEDNRELWQIHAVRLGFKHEFLLRAILTVAALHLRSLHPLQSSYYDLMASTHQSFALEAARDALTQVDENNCHAIFLFSCLIVIMTSASFRKQAGVEVHQEILEYFFLLRGCNSVLQLYWDTLRNSFIYPLLDEVNQTETKPGYQIKDAEHIMDLLTTCCYSGPDGDPEAAKAYTMTVYELMKTFSQVSILRERGQGLYLSCCIWPNTVPQKYLELLADQQPQALVILAHYAVLLHWADKEWFMRGMARYLLDTIRASVGEEWQAALQWPCSEIESNIV